jgi:hypothetical protein
MFNRFEMNTLFVSIKKNEISIVWGHLHFIGERIKYTPFCGGGGGGGGGGQKTV